MRFSLNLLFALGLVLQPVLGLVLPTESVETHNGHINEDKHLDSTCFKTWYGTHHSPKDRRQVSSAMPHTGTFSAQLPGSSDSPEFAFPFPQTFKEETRGGKPSSRESKPGPFKSPAANEVPEPGGENKLKTRAINPVILLQWSQTTEQLAIATARSNALATRHQELLTQRANILQGPTLIQQAALLLRAARIREIDIQIDQIIAQANTVNAQLNTLRQEFRRISKLINEKPPAYDDIGPPPPPPPPAPGIIPGGSGTDDRGLKKEADSSASDAATATPAPAPAPTP